MNRRRLLSAAGPAALALAGAATAGAVQAAAPDAPPTFYSTLDPKQKAALDRLREIVVAQAEGRYVAPPDPDAGLHALCAEFERLHRLAYLEGNDAWEADHHASWRVADELEGMCALTEAGHRAKGRVAVLQLNENRAHGEFIGSGDARFALNTLMDWLGMTA